ncbi:MAG: T9SS type A sorting domain-containing protein [Saprospiraceae bacterium]|nr:G8 domain-containing protein [Candidatus Brachybacter algidus]MBL0117991.1 T9SS type A sorting domain-containing protein [Candidatus Brachybacter algidus]
MIFKNYFIALLFFGQLTFCCNYATAQLYWSNSSTWTSFGATKPVAGSAVVIPDGIEIILNESPPALASLNIMGKLQFANQDLNLTAGWIMVMGTLEVGTEASPFTSKAVITLNATNPNEEIMGMGTRGIMVMGGQLELHGNPPSAVKTKINNHAISGSSTITLLDAVSWNVNDQIVIAPTDYYGAGNSNAQRSKITTVNSPTSLTLQDGLNAHRWGKLQYLTPTGMSLTYAPPPANLLSGTPTILDERGEVGNLTRNIVVQSVDDALWQNSGFGCHIMVMRMGGMVGRAHLNGVEIRRGGQAGKLGRYPFHWHMLSYQGSNTLPDATGQYIRNSVINQSAHRGIVIHGTNGSEVSNNIVYDVRGHGIFTEDASERRNIINGNLVLKVRKPLNGNALKVHEEDNSSGLWVSNPDNTLTNNTAADCEGFGFWLAFPEQTFGLSAAININPSLQKFGVFNNNHAHSNFDAGIFLDNVEIDIQGNTYPHRYTSTIDGSEPEWPFDNVLTYELADYTTWKNNSSGIWNRSASVRNRRVVSADNTSSFFSGASDNINSGEIERSLVVGVSLNYNMNGVELPDQWNAGQRAAFASYHSTFNIKDNVVVNFVGVEDEPSGAFAVNDYYLIPMDKGTVRNTNNLIINSHPGVRTYPGEAQHVYGVIWDYHNYWGGPEGHDNNYVFDNPFYTYGLIKHIVPPNPEVSGGVIVDGPFYGFYSYNINGIERSYEKIVVTRTDIDGIPVGSWTVEAGQPGDILGNMRHYAAHPSGYYYLDFPTIDNINDFNVLISNMLTSDDYQVMSVEYSGDFKITNLFSSTAYNMSEFGNNLPYPENQQDVHTYTAVTSFQAVVSAAQGEVYWHDRANNKVWFKVRGGLNSGDPDQPETADANLYKEFRVRAYGELDPTPLAINFSTFEVNKESERAAKLVWSFETDQNSVNFDIERMSTGSKFSSIGKIKDRKALIGQNQFFFIDEKPYYGDNYYRIKAIDDNGKAKYTSVKSVNISTKSDVDISIYPNPVSTLLNLKFMSSAAGKTNVLIYNTMGELVKSEAIEVKIGENNSVINLSKLPNGVYTIQMLIEGKMYTEKIIKN